MPNQPREHRQSLEITVGEAVNKSELCPRIIVFVHALQGRLNETQMLFVAPEAMRSEVASLNPGATSHPAK
jgi:hypothetical protein